MRITCEQDRLAALDQRLDDLGDRRRLSRTGHTKNERIVLSSQDRIHRLPLIRVEMLRYLLTPGLVELVEAWLVVIHNQAAEVLRPILDEQTGEIRAHLEQACCHLILVYPEDNPLPVHLVTPMRRSREQRGRVNLVRQADGDVRRSQVEHEASPHADQVGFDGDADGIAFADMT